MAWWDDLTKAAGDALGGLGSWVGEWGDSTPDNKPWWNDIGGGIASTVGEWGDSTPDSTPWWSGQDAVPARSNGPQYDYSNYGYTNTSTSGSAQYDYSSYSPNSQQSFAEQVDSWNPSLAWLAENPNYLEEYWKESKGDILGTMGRGLEYGTKALRATVDPIFRAPSLFQTGLDSKEAEWRADVFGEDAGLSAINPGVNDKLHDVFASGGSVEQGKKLWESERSGIVEMIPDILNPGLFIGDFGAGAALAKGVGKVASKLETPTIRILKGSAETDNLVGNLLDEIIPVEGIDAETLNVAINGVLKGDDATGGMFKGWTEAPETQAALGKLREADFGVDFSDYANPETGLIDRSAITEIKDDIYKRAKSYFVGIEESANPSFKYGQAPFKNPIAKKMWNFNRTVKDVTGTLFLSISPRYHMNNLVSNLFTTAQSGAYGTMRAKTFAKYSSERGWGTTEQARHQLIATGIETSGKETSFWSGVPIMGGLEKKGRELANTLEMASKNRVFVKNSEEIYWKVWRDRLVQMGLPPELASKLTSAHNFDHLDAAFKAMKQGKATSYTPDIIEDATRFENAYVQNAVLKVLNSDDPLKAAQEVIKDLDGMVSEVGEQVAKNTKTAKVVTDLDDYGVGALKPEDIKARTQANEALPKNISIEREIARLKTDKAYRRRLADEFKEYVNDPKAPQRRRQTLEDVLPKGNLTLHFDADGMLSRNELASIAEHITKAESVPRANGKFYKLVDIEFFPKGTKKLNGKVRTTDDVNLKFGIDTGAEANASRWMKKNPNATTDDAAQHIAEKRTKDTSKSDSMPLIVTNDMAKQLRDLGYTPAQIRKMNAKEAWEKINAGPNTPKKEGVGSWRELPPDQMPVFNPDEHVYDIDTGIWYPKSKSGETVVKPRESFEEFVGEAKPVEAAPDGQMSMFDSTPDPNFVNAPIESKAEQVANLAEELGDTKAQSLLDPPDAVNFMQSEVNRAKSLIERITQEAGTPTPAGEYTQAQMTQWYRQAKQAMRESISEAKRGADAEVKRVLRDYRYRTRADEYLDMMVPYHYWFTRNSIFQIIYAAQNPGQALAAINVFKDWWDNNQSLPVSQRFTIPLGNINGTDVRLDPVSMIFPFAKQGTTFMQELSPESPYDKGLGEEISSGDVVGAGKSIFNILDKGVGVGPNVGIKTMVRVGQRFAENSNDPVVEGISRKLLGNVEDASGPMFQQEELLRSALAGAGINVPNLAQRILYGSDLNTAQRYELANILAVKVKNGEVPMEQAAEAMRNGDGNPLYDTTKQEVVSRLGLNQFVRYMGLPISSKSQDAQQASAMREGYSSLPAYSPDRKEFKSDNPEIQLLWNAAGTPEEREALSRKAQYQVAVDELEAKYITPFASMNPWDTERREALKAYNEGKSKAYEAFKMNEQPEREAYAQRPLTEEEQGYKDRLAQIQSLRAGKPSYDDFSDPNDYYDALDKYTAGLSDADRKLMFAADNEELANKGDWLAIAYKEWNDEVGEGYGALSDISLRKKAGQITSSQAKQLTAEVKAQFPDTDASKFAQFLIDRFPQADKAAIENALKGQILPGLENMSSMRKVGESELEWQARVNQYSGSTSGSSGSSTGRTSQKTAGGYTSTETDTKKAKTAFSQRYGLLTSAEKNLAKQDALIRAVMDPGVGVEPSEQQYLIAYNQLANIKAKATEEAKKNPDERTKEARGKFWTALTAMPPEAISTFQNDMLLSLVLKKGSKGYVPPEVYADALSHLEELLTGTKAPKMNALTQVWLEDMKEAYSTGGGSGGGRRYTAARKTTYTRPTGVPYFSESTSGLRGPRYNWNRN